MENHKPQSSSSFTERENMCKNNMIKIIEDGNKSIMDFLSYKSLKRYKNLRLQDELNISRVNKILNETKKYITSMLNEELEEFFKQKSIDENTLFISKLATISSVMKRLDLSVEDFTSLIIRAKYETNSDSEEIEERLFQSHLDKLVTYMIKAKNEELQKEILDLEESLVHKD